MKSTSASIRRRTRPPAKQDEIIKFLRGRILRGKLKPGDRLPPRTEIEKRFSTTGVTVQRAFDRLRDDGFVAVRGRQGTFVADHPPQLHHYALVFPTQEDRDDSWVYFWTVLMDVARQIKLDTGDSLSIYTGIDAHDPGPDYELLLHDVEARRLAGIIFASPAFLVEDTPILTAPGIARVSFAAASRYGFPAITMDTESFLDRAVDHLASRRCKRIAVITVPGIQDKEMAYLHKVAAGRGIQIQPRWVQVADQSAAEWAANLALMIFHGRPKDRPDGLIITDDNLVEHACRGLAQGGLRVSEDVEVVAHCNFPPPVPSVLPLARLGYDLRALLRVCIEYLEKQRDGKRVRQLTRMPALFEWEIAPPYEARVPRTKSRTALLDGTVC